MSLLVFGHEVVYDSITERSKTYIIPLYVPTERYKKTIRLFFLKSADGSNSHYCAIKDMSRLICSQVSKKRHKKFVCDYCLNYFGRQNLLDEHTEYCSKHDAVNTIFPKPGKNVLKFKNIQNCARLKFIVTLNQNLHPLTRCMGKRGCIRSILHQLSVCMLFLVLRDFQWILSHT